MGKNYEKARDLVAAGYMVTATDMDKTMTVSPEKKQQEWDACSSGYHQKVLARVKATQALNSAKADEAVAEDEFKKAFEAMGLPMNLFETVKVLVGYGLKVTL